MVTLKNLLSHIPQEHINTDTHAGSMSKKLRRQKEISILILRYNTLAGITSADLANRKRLPQQIG